jgi:hypothetical protein
LLFQGQISGAFRLLLLASLAGALHSRGELVTNLPPIADTSLLESSPDNNLGGLANIPCGTTAQGRSRGLFKFDLTRVPANASVTAAEFTITAVTENPSQHPASVFALNRLLKDWGEGTGSLNAGDPANTNEATWNNRFHPSVAWTALGAAPGSDYVAAFSATNLIDTLTTYTFNSTTGLVADVQKWIGNPATNFGWIFVSQSEGTSFTVRRFASREDPSSPVLTVHYTLPPVISTPSISGNKIHFSFLAESNRAYTVETRSSLQSGNWATLTNVLAQPVPALIQVSHALTNTAGFYRVR